MYIVDLTDHIAYGITVGLQKEVVLSGVIIDLDRTG
jgi:hypothetical protein